MKTKVVIPLLMAIILALVAVRIGRNILERRLRAQPQSRPTGKVVVVRGNRTAGHALRSEDLRLADVPREFIPAATFARVDDAAGRVLTTAVVKEQMLLETLLAPKGAVGGLQAIVPMGKRAVTVEVNEVSGLAGLVTPGCNVDVVATLQDEKTRETIGRTIVQNVVVSAVGQQLKTGDGNAPPSNAAATATAFANKSVTLIVSPDQAEAIDLASTKSKLRLVLRSAGDNTPLDTEGVTLARLTSSQPTEEEAPVPDRMMEMLASIQQRMASLEPTTRPAAPAPPAEVVAPAPPRWAVQVIRGSSESTVYFDGVNADAAATKVDEPKGDPFSMAR